MIDKYKRNINYLRISLTDRCNLRCRYCMPEEGVVPKLNHEDILRFEQILKIIKASSLIGINKIRYTGGEPLIMNGIDNLIYETSSIEGIEDISITTNGILLCDAAGDLKKAGLNRVNISLDTLNEKKFNSITRGGDLNKVIQAIEKCISLGYSPVKINVVLLKGINDDEIQDFINLTLDMPIHVRFIELMPMGTAVDLYKDENIKCDEIIKNFTVLEHITNEKSSTAELYKLPGAKGLVGFIRPISCKFCSSCNRIRLTSTGTIKPCLHSKQEYDIKPYIENEENLILLLKKIILSKPVEHHLEAGISSSKKMMYEIGG
ncbi:GTP 3',8-cyclase MoaA [Clostridium tyrobutyricum]|uniref:GTP 3',8-cyclase MoaA n=1 Tax=Clostridium tyrobutyricum TaxID=1519 RepID=UPI001C38D2FC|nr:GTP 3',8-cyclase MoaA [Clostridium tyrobutyricum]MBV4428202.1 GTP 3',8-cyclase MoaA [Clostridium tyrobutyricum]MBV4442579.1 GTP 3',8-cyclase MoaA [Clostridium tyrobutyricum]